MSKYSEQDVFLVEIENVYNGKSYILKDGSIIHESILDKYVHLDERELEHHLSSEAKKKAHEKGMWDAWNIARRIYGEEDKGGLPMTVITDVFGVEHLYDVLFDYTPDDAMKIIAEYDAEMNKVKEGDVVEILEQTGVVLAIDDEVASVYVLTDKYAKVQEVSLHKLKKVGYSIDVRKVLTGACCAESMKEVNGSV